MFAGLTWYLYSIRGNQRAAMSFRRGVNVLLSQSTFFKPILLFRSARNDSDKLHGSFIGMRSGYA